MSYFSSRFYWNLVDLQCCVYFLQQSDSDIYINIYVNIDVLFHIFFHYGLSSKAKFKNGAFFSVKLCNFFKIYFKLEDNCFTMLCWFLLFDKVNQLYLYTWPPSLEPPSHPWRPSRSTRLSSLCYAAACHQLSILHMYIQGYKGYTCQCFSLHLSHFLLPLFCPQVILCVCISFPVLQIGSSVPKNGLF